MMPEQSGVLPKMATITHFLAERGQMGPADLAEATGIARSTVYRILEGMSDVDLLLPLDGARAELSLRWARLADAARRAQIEWRPFCDRLPEITELTGMTSFVTVRRGDITVCIEWSQGSGIDALVLRPGRTLPLHAGATGRATLAALSPDDREDYLSRGPFHAFNPNTLTTRASLERDVETTLKNGYALSVEDITIGVGAVGIAIPADTMRGAQGAVSVGGLAGEISARHNELARTLTSVCAQVEDSRV